MSKQWAFIWRESIYKNDYVCPNCGAKLYDKNKMEPTENLCVEATTQGSPRIRTDGDLGGAKLGKYAYCFCKCLEPVAVYKELETSLDLPPGEYGEWGGQ